MNGCAIMLTQVGNGEHRNPLFGGQFGQRLEHATHDCVEVRITGPNVRVHGIDHNQAAVGEAIECGTQFFEIMPQVGN